MDKDWKMAGKTGTSQVKEITKEEREETVVIAKKRKDRDHALFVGYAPTKRPKYAVSVIIEHGGSGSQKAAPIGRDILLACKKVKTSGYRV
jgi:penicillin-binding protein 2